MLLALRVESQRLPTQVPLRLNEPGAERGCQVERADCIVRASTCVLLTFLPCFSSTIADADVDLFVPLPVNIRREEPRGLRAEARLRRPIRLRAQTQDVLEQGALPHEERCHLRSETPTEEVRKGSQEVPLPVLRAHSPHSHAAPRSIRRRPRYRQHASTRRPGKAPRFVFGEVQRVVPIGNTRMTLLLAILVK